MARSLVSLGRLMLTLAVTLLLLHERRTQAEDTPRLTTLSETSTKFVPSSKPYVILRRGEIEAVVVNNEAVNDEVLPGHRAGYSGLGSLKHTKRDQNLFVPSVSGLN